MYIILFSIYTFLEKKYGKKEDYCFYHINMAKLYYIYIYEFEIYFTRI